MIMAGVVGGSPAMAMVVVASKSVAVAVGIKLGKAVVAEMGGSKVIHC